MVVTVFIPDIIDNIVVLLSNTVEMPLNLSSGVPFRRITNLGPLASSVQDLSTQYGSVCSKRFLSRQIPAVVALYVVGQIGGLRCIVRRDNRLLDTLFVRWIYVPR